ncbi:death-on-curing protein [Aureimonas endophytica]|uniref:Death-on-curing protein n=1 Tax=Aureimonas endophytica TaxID=2027858 RepID=A0A916ZE02_9HYPH|nr:type II toxin-antitoxin system death-on-curing family toxin [Aureimonas endophytica]GGD91103.1 death-on-curing protein [Aureimonas endophytica]
MKVFLLGKSDVLQIHAEQIAEHGGLAGIRDEGLLESALARADNLITYGRAVGICDIAASLGFGLARNHPFLDGNKRTSLVVALTVLELNGRTVVVPPEQLLITWQALAAGDLGETALADWLRLNSQPL